MVESSYSFEKSVRKICPPQGEPPGGECLYLQIVAVDRQSAAPQLEAELAFFVGADAPELLDLHPSATQVDRSPSVEVPGRLTEHPPEPAAQGMRLLSFSSHAAPSRHANRCQLLHIYGNGGCAYDSEEKIRAWGTF